MQDTESTQVRLAIKRLLKQGGHQQKDLAAALDVSVPTVKRLLNGKELGLERLVQIARFFQLSVFELFDLCRDRQLEMFQFTPAQETYLAAHLANVVVFRSLLRGFSVAKIKERYKFTDAKLTKILTGLDKVNLIEFWSQDKLKIKAKWPFKWIEGGVLQKTYMQPLLKKIFSESYSRSALAGAKGTGGFFRPYELVLREATHKQLREELGALLENYRFISKLEMATVAADELQDVTGMITCDSFSAWDEMGKQ
jgi:transcriptional regulator with XRE-family HTH domain